MPDLQYGTGNMSDLYSKPSQHFLQIRFSCLSFPRAVGELPHACQQPLFRAAVDKVPNRVRRHPFLSQPSPRTGRRRQFLRHRLIAPAAGSPHHKYRNRFHRNLFVRDPQRDTLFFPRLLRHTHFCQRAFFATGLSRNADRRPQVHQRFVKIPRTLRILTSLHQFRDFFLHSGR